MKLISLLLLTMIALTPVAYSANWLDKIEADVETEWHEKLEAHVAKVIKKRDKHLAKYVEAVDYLDELDADEWIAIKKKEYNDNVAYVTFDGTDTHILY